MKLADLAKVVAAMKRGSVPFAFMLALAIAAIGALSAHRYVTLDRELTAAALDRDASIGSLAAATLAEKFERLTDIGGALATRVRFQEMIDAGRWSDAAEILRRVPGNFPVIERLFITDASGTLMAGVPELPHVIGSSFAHLEWFKELSRDWKPHVSGVYRESAESARNVIAVAAPIRVGEGRIAGILVMQVRLEKFLAWASLIDPNPMSRVLVIDGDSKAAFDSQRSGSVIVAEPAPDPVVQRLAPGVTGARVVRAPDGGDFVFSYVPASHRWGIATTRPAALVFSARDQLLRLILLDAVAIAVCSLAAIVLGFLMVRHRRRAEADRVRLEERRRADEEIAEQRAFLRQVIDLDSNMIFTKDRDGRFTLVNQALAEAYGTSVGNLLGKTDDDFNPRRRALERLRRDDLEVMEHRRAKLVPEERITDAAGNVRWLQTAKHPIIGAQGRADMILCVSTDITQRKRAELALVRAHAMAKLAHVVTGVGGVFQSWSDTLPGLIGVEPRSLPRTTRDWLARIHPADQEGFRVKAIEAGKSGARVDVEYRMPRVDGGWIHIRQTIEPLEAEGSTAGVRWFSTLQDVSTEKLAEQRVRDQLEHLRWLDQITRALGEHQDLRSIYQVVMRSLEDGLPIDFGCVCRYDAAAHALTVASVGTKSAPLARELAMNEQATIDIDQNGLSRCVQGQLVYEPDIGKLRFAFPERLAGAGLHAVVMAPLKSENQVFGLLVAARRDRRGFTSTECEFLRQLSEHVALAAYQAQLHESLQRAYDDLRQTQSMAMQEERLRALGQMASGIAHDINNALSPVSLYAESMLETENLSERARRYLETIQRAVDDVAETVARMREFYRQREAQMELAPVDMNQIAQQVLELTKARWSTMAIERGIMIRADADLACDLPPIMGVESDVRQALINLVLNAVDAMPEGGTLTLRSRLAGAAPDQRVIVEVADTGLGMDEETRKRCMEPFFTTKGERGTGLGLAMVFGMVQRHSSSIEIDSAPGTGTTMRLVFDPLTTSLAPEREVLAPQVHKPLRLLLADDDPVLLKSLHDLLEADGHFIALANSGAAGIAEFRAALERNEPYAAVITDLGMPYVDGRKVAEAVKQASTGTPVILLTGWGHRMVAEGEIPANVDRVLAKPPRLREVREALMQLCASQEASKAA